MTESEFLQQCNELTNLAQTLLLTHDKPTSFCSGCPALQETRVQPSGGIYDFVLLGPAPIPGDTYPINRLYGARQWNLLRRTIASLGVSESTLIPPVLCAPHGKKSGVPTKCITKCRPLIQYMLKQYKPKVIVAMGAEALKTLGIKEVASENRGRVFSWGDIPVMVTYDYNTVFNYKSGYALYDHFYLHLTRAAKLIRTPLPTIDMDRIPIRYISEQDEADNLFKALCAVPKETIVVFDIETAHWTLPTKSGLDFFYKDDAGRNRHKLTVFSLAYEDKEGIEQTFVVDYSKVKSVTSLKKFLTSEVQKCTFNGAFDVGSLEHYLKIKVNAHTYDVMLLYYLLDEGRAGAAITDKQAKFNLKSHVVDYVPELAGYEEEGDIKKALRDYSLLKGIWDKFLKYAGLDSLGTLRLFKKALQLLPPSSIRMHKAYMLHVLRALVDLHETGICVSKEYYTDLCSKLRVDMQASLATVYNEIKKKGNWLAYRQDFELERKNAKRKNKLSTLWPMAEKFNYFAFEPSKSDHIQRLVYSPTWLNLPVGNRTDGGAPSTDEDTLTPLAEKHPVIRAILDYEKASKALEMIESQILPSIKYDGRIHCNFWQIGTRSGRLSASKPNLQQMGTSRIGWQTNADGSWKLDEKGQHLPRWEAEVKGGFVAPPGMTLLYADYKTLEIYVLAYYCLLYDTKNTNLLKALRDGYDIHSFVASKLFNLPYEEILEHKEGKHETIRSLAKRAIFGIVYGTTETGFAYKNSKTLEWTKKFFNDVFTQFPEIQSYVQGIHQKARTNLQVTTMFGNIRHLPILQFGDNRRALRQGQNSPVQGTAAMMGMLSTALLVPRIRARGGEVNLVVHDSNLLSVLDNKQSILEGIKLLHVCMIDFFVKSFPWVAVPPRIDVKIGPSWSGTKKLPKSLLEEALALELTKA